MVRHELGVPLKEVLIVELRELNFGPDLAAIDGGCGAERSVVFFVFDGL